MRATIETIRVLLHRSKSERSETPLVRRWRIGMAQLHFEAKTYITLHLSVQVAVTVVILELLR
jgi:hypothetical protein